MIVNLSAFLGNYQPTDKPPGQTGSDKGRFPIMIGVIGKVNLLKHPVLDNYSYLEQF